MERAGLTRAWAGAASAALLVAACCGGGCARASDAQAPQSGLDRTYTVRRGDFNIAFRLEGQLDAIRSQQLSFDGRRGHKQLKLVEMMPDRSFVASNDVIFRLSDEWFVEQEKDLLRKLQLAEEDYKLALKDMEIIRADNLADLKHAADTLRDARDQLLRYSDEDAPRQRRELLQATQERADAFDAAKADLEDAKRALTDSIAQEAEVIAAAQKRVEDAERLLTRADQEMEKAWHALRIFKRYDHPQKRDAMQKAVIKAQLGVQRTIVNNNAKVSKKRIEIANREKLNHDYRQDLNGILADMKQLEIRAQTDGMLIHGENRRNRWEAPKEIKVGADINIGETIGVIPDVSKFKVQVNIPEEHRSHIRAGLPVVIRARAVPDLTLTGEIFRISGASTPVIPWDPGSPKVYASDISTDAADERLTPGMTVQVEIVVERVADVLFVPVAGTYNREGRHYCLLLREGVQVEREVRTGRFSTDFVEILEGLEPGDQILLNRPG